MERIFRNIIIIVWTVVNQTTSVRGNKDLTFLTGVGHI